MELGTLVADRFLVERRAGSGGMSDVYLARDQSDGSSVALKVLRVRHELADTQGLSEADAARFTREAETLATLRHPAIVRYVAHGITPMGAAYLATEWLEGTTLSARLSRGPLSVADTLALGRRVADALAEAHARGIVHRDVKPSNLLLVGDDVLRVKLIDFGIARAEGSRTSLTLTGAVLGTPGYMAPEQARGDRAIDARADVFCLGCVLFRCLTGRAAFEGSDVLAVLVKVVLEEPPRVLDHAANVPPELDALVADMLAKAPEERPSDGAVVAATLRAIEASGALPPRSASRPAPKAITTAERRVVTVVLAKPREVRSAGRAELGRQVDSPTPETATRLEDASSARAMAARHGGTLHPLADGSLLVSFAGRATPTDLAAGAARCALALRSALVEASVAVVSGTALVDRPVPLGEIIDRGVALLAAGPARGVRVDDDTAALLDGRFKLEVTDAGRALVREGEHVETLRTLLGKWTPCVGRRRELGLLEAALETCVADETAQAALVIGAAGVGKSRLRYELLQRAPAMSPAPTVWLARGDPLRSGAAFGLLSQFVRRAARLVEGEPLSVRQAKLRERVALTVAEDERGRVAELLGEIVGAPFPDEGRVELAAARQNAMLMSDQMRRAWLDFVDAETRRGPLLLVLEDLHSGDRPTVELLDATLRRFADRPILILALARPELDQAFPSLWATHPVTRVTVQELPRKACLLLARQVLGEAAGEDALLEIADKSGGNAFFLEELLRAKAQGDAGDVPRSVIAMVQSRLERLDVESRRLLRAGSVFGDVFWRGGVAALLGAEGQGAPVDEALAELVRGEWIAPRPEARFRGEREYVLRHALVREAVYEMLTDEDRRLGHHLAGAWLVAAGESDAALVAEHLERGHALEEARGWYERAASQALEGSDFQGAITLATRAIDCGASGDGLGLVALIRGEAHRWRGEHAEAVRWCDEAVRSLGLASPRRVTALAELVVAASYLGERERTIAAARALYAAWPAEPTGVALIAAARAIAPVIFAGDDELGRRLGARIDASAHLFEDDPLVVAWVSRARAVRARFDGEPDRYRTLMALAAEFADRAGDKRAACNYRMTVGFAFLELGGFAEAIDSLRRALAEAERMGIETVAATTRANLGLALGRAGEHEEARQLELAAIEAFDKHGDRRSRGCARVYLATILRGAGDLTGAEGEARRAVTDLATIPTMMPLALATLSEVLLAQGRVEDAAESARAAAEAVYSVSKVDEGEALARVVHAEALEASLDHRAAREVVVLARERLLARAQKIADPVWRQSFLERVPEHARTLALYERLARRP